MPYDAAEEKKNLTFENVVAGPGAPGVPMARQAGRVSGGCGGLVGAELFAGLGALPWNADGLWFSNPAARGAFIV